LRPELGQRVPVSIAHKASATLVASSHPRFFPAFHQAAAQNLRSYTTNAIDECEKLRWNGVIEKPPKRRGSYSPTDDSLIDDKAIFCLAIAVLRRTGAGRSRGWVAAAYQFAILSERSSYKNEPHQP